MLSLGSIETDQVISETVIKGIFTLGLQENNHSGAQALDVWTVFFILSLSFFSSFSPVL